MLRRVGKSVNEKWIIGGDFNAILDNAKKEGGRRKPNALMDDFRTIIDELSMVELKIDNEWFTWVNNWEDTNDRKPRDWIKDPRLNFRYDVCWAKENEAKNIIKDEWQKGSMDIMGKIEKVGKDLSVWQYNRYKSMRN
ncbi:hypothetical protein GOBAR_DD32254 [Gossypium barbadense]|nr:hypothetical protein GOBAR_DD32254 [Gossypium barbadense]